MNFHILTLFPEMVMQGLSTSIIGKAKENGLISIEAIQIRDFTKNKHKKVDDYPYGGGAGMLMQAQPVYDAWKSVADKTKKKPRTVYLTPQGQTFTQPMAKELAKEEDLVLLCGHYEGIDERVLEEIVTDYVSIGDFVLTGGELPAMVMVDAISRMVPGVLTNEESGCTESFEGNLLEYPQYSRPEVWMGKEVPKVLLSGNQKKIRSFRKEAAILRTKERRPDMYAKYEALEKCREQMQKQKLLHMDMIELIARGQAELVYHSDDVICLFDTVSGIYFHTVCDTKSNDIKSSDTKLNDTRLKDIKLNNIIVNDTKINDVKLNCANQSDIISNNIKLGIIGLEKIKEHAKQDNGNAVSNMEKIEYLVLHQEFMVEPAREMFGLSKIMTCHQAVYTKKEKLPITGLYSINHSINDEKNTESIVRIERLKTEHFELIAKAYGGEEGAEYLKERLEKGCLYGAFLYEEKEIKLAGFIGTHAEGSIGMLQVFPEYRRRKLGKALETYMINQALELGQTPFGQVVEGNEASMRLQESLGLCFAKSKVYWMEKEKSTLQ